MTTPPADPPTRLRFGPDGLIPAVAQDVRTGEVLMVAFMNEAALAETRRTDRADYWSRSRGRLWRKGESSGHEQVVEDILVNCEENSVLLKVRQIGAVCHDGYPTCYYRRLEPDGTLTVDRARSFDPGEVYGRAGKVEDGPDGSRSHPSSLVERSRVAFGALAWLRHHDLAAVSGTSRLLRAADDGVTGRIADELRELAGVLDGSHRHRDMTSDALLEGRQVWYWLTLRVLRAAASWHETRPDRALAVPDDAASPLLLARLLQAEAAGWERPGEGGDPAARAHATLMLVAQACRAAGVEPSEIVTRELDELRSKPYLAPYFAGIDAA